MRLLSLLCLTGCAATPPARWCDTTADGVALSFPAPPQARRVDERPFADALIVTAREGGRSYELALFRFGRASPEQRRALRARVEQGLTSRPGAEAFERGIVPLAGRPALALSIALDNGRRGRHWIGYLDDGRMLQLSVVGPDDAPTREASRIFSASVDTAASGALDKTRAPCSR